MSISLSLTYLSIHYSDCFYECCSYLEFEDLLPFSFANKHYNKISDSPLFWKNAILEDVNKYKELIFSEFYVGLRHIRTLKYHFSNYEEKKKEEEKESTTNLNKRKKVEILENKKFHLNIFNKVEDLSILMWNVYFGDFNKNYIYPKTIKKEVAEFFQAPVPSTSLKSLSIFGSSFRELYFPLYNSLILQFPFLIKLELSQISLNSFSIMENLCNLESLSLKGIKILPQEENGKELLTILNKLKQLTCLTISDIYHKNTEGVRNPLTFSNSTISFTNPNIKELEVCLSHNSILNTFVFISNHVQLDKLILNGYYHDSWATKELNSFQQYEKKISIKKIELHNFNLKNDSWLKKIDQIESFALVNNTDNYIFEQYLSTSSCSFLDLNKHTLKELKVAEVQISLCCFSKLSFLSKLYLKGVFGLDYEEFVTITKCFLYLEQLKIEKCPDISDNEYCDENNQMISNPYSILLSLSATLKEFIYVGELKEETIHLLQNGFKNKFKYVKY